MNNSRPPGKRREQKGRKIKVRECVKRKACTMAAKAAKKLKARSICGYINHSNPFGDPNLTHKFVWQKKIERDVSVKAENQREGERKAEIERIKKRREAMGLEKERHILARESSCQDSEKREDKFQFYQRKVRSVTRMREIRMKPIDVLWRHLNAWDDLDVDFCEPYTVFEGLTVEEMKEIRYDIQMHLDMDRDIDYWEALMVVCNSELCKEDALDQARIHGEEELLAEERGLHSSIEADVRNLLEGKSSSELEALWVQIESQMSAGTAMVVEFWEALLTQLRIYKAKACLREIHAERLCKRSQLLDMMEEDPSRPTDPEEEAGSFSPQLLNEEAINPEEDRGILETNHEAVREEHQQPPPADAVNFERAVGFGSGADANKNRSRKPKYFNRVHTGYEWNRYNRTHYDRDDPPPKIVQGYKFDIFYPDLVDKTEAPTYAIEKDGNSEETCIIRFHAGPPYEDMAFRIVKKEWEYSRKKGFKCTFERGILHVYFNFKSYHYRR